MPDMNWFASFFDFAAKLGITAIAFAGAVWAAVTFLGQKYATLYFDKQLEAHKEALKSIYGQELETHKKWLRLSEQLSPIYKWTAGGC